MKHLLRNAKSICMLVLAMVLCMSLPSVAFAAGNTTNYEDDISAVLTRINAEYGTNIHVLTESELEKYGLTAAEPAAATAFDGVDLEEALRYIAEVQIPQFERTTQEAQTAMAALSGDMSVLRATSSKVTATEEIDYATAVVVAYITEDAYGNAVWGDIVESDCYTSISQTTYFMANSTSATHADARRTIHWTGEGDYISNINGNYYYLYSGTQYASMYAADYD